MGWLNQHAVAMLAATLAAAATRSGVPIALIAAASFAMLEYGRRRELAALRPWGGYANLVTALRILLILGAALSSGLGAPAMLALFAVNVALDAVDGYAARRLRAETALGALLDREADALFVLVAYFYFFVEADAGAWILLPGLLPYLYRIFVLIAGDPSADIPRQRLAVALAGVNFACLLAAVAAPPRARPLLLTVSASIVLSSFGVSFWKLRRHDYSLS
jgi:phosphatidylglycerophosphate synthase